MAIIPERDAAKEPVVVPVCKEAVTRQTASRWINVKAHDPNKRIISEIYCAASRVVKSAWTAPRRKREREREGRLSSVTEERARVEWRNRKREKTKRGRWERVREDEKRDERNSRWKSERGKKRKREKRRKIRRLPSWDDCGLPLSVSLRGNAL